MIGYRRSIGKKDMSKIYVTRPIPEPGVGMLRDAGYEVDINSDDRVLSAEELKAKVVGVDAILSLLTDKITGDVLDAAGPNLKIVANYAVGYDNVDLDAAANKNIVVTNTPGVLTEAVAEHSLALIMAVARKIVEADKYVRDGKYKQWEPQLLVGEEMFGKTIGIVGMGRIGSYLAKICAAGLEMKVMYQDMLRNDLMEGEFGIQKVELAELVKNSDVISIHTPLTDETKHLIDTEEFAVMKKGAILINTSRGPVVSEVALIEALKSGKIAGAGIDVFEFEPEISLELMTAPNLVMTPHIASATTKARQSMSEIVAKNIIAVLSGQLPINPVVKK